LKNDLEQIDLLVDFFDFSINEQCHEYDECDALQAFINKEKPVLNAEYKLDYINNETARNVLCEVAENRRFSTLILPLDLDDTFRFACSGE